MKTTKYLNYNSNQQVLTQLLGQLMRAGNSSNGYSGGVRRQRSSIRRTAARARRRAAARPQANAAASGGTKPAASQDAKKSADSSANAATATTQKRNATESSAGPEKKKPALNETATGGESSESKTSEVDPYLKGLCEDGVRWYLRYLKEGLDPKAACKKAWEHRTEPSEYEPQWGKEFLIREFEEPKQTNKHRLRWRAAKKPEINEDYRIAVHPKDFPDQMLDLPSVIQLQDAIVAEIAKGADVKLQFASVHLRPGALLLDCMNEETVNWLKDIVTKLPDWEGPELTTSQERVIPDAYVMTVALPKSIGQEFERTLALISAQNEDLNTEVWKFVNEREENEKQVVTIRVDKDSFNTMKRNEWKLYYRFEKVSVHFHRYLRYGSNPILWITNPSCHKQNQVKPPGPANTL